MIMNSYQFTSNQTNQPTKWQARIEKRRNEGVDVLGYVDQIVRAKHVSLDEVTTFLNPEELQAMQSLVAQRAKEKAELEAQREAAALEYEREIEEHKRLQAAFWEKNPPSPLTAVPDIKTESELFDILSRYRIGKVEYSFEMVDYHWDEFRRIEDPTIEAWLLSDIEISIQEELPDDDEAGRIGNAIYDAIEELASERAVVAADEGKLQDGIVTFDVQHRRIKLEAVVEVTRDEDCKKEWAPDDET
jgi:hypothetical protein